GSGCSVGRFDLVDEKAGAIVIFKLESGFSSRLSFAAVFAERRRSRYSEPNGSVFDDRRPRLRSPRRPDPPRRARTARHRQRDDQRARRALRHVADRDEEARPAARGGAARHDGEGRPRPQMHVGALRIRGHQHVAAAARPLREGRRTHERSTMSTTTKKGKQQSAKSTNKKGGFTAE